MKPQTAAGRALLECEAYNSRSFALITAEAIVAIEREARKSVLVELAALHRPWSHKERKKIATLDRRARFLEAREGGDRDEAEAAAIRWALQSLDVLKTEGTGSS